MNRLSFAAGFAAGYVAGARAGREKYDQIVKIAKNTAEHPAVQQAAGTVQTQATNLSQKVGDQLHDKVPQMAQSMGDRIPGMKHRNGHGDQTGDTMGTSSARPFATSASNQARPSQSGSNDIGP
jgi:hypothetical protein